MRSRRFVVAGLAVLVLTAAVALVDCGGGSSDGANAEDRSTATTIGDPSAPSPAPCRPIGNIRTADSKVRVVLDEFTMTASSAAVPAGVVGFALDNRGAQPHELLVLANVAIDAIPTDSAGGLEESRLPPGSIVGRVPAFPAGETCHAVLTLSPGSYVLMDDLTVLRPNGVVVSNLAKGMVAELAVR